MMRLGVVEMGLVMCIGLLFLVVIAAVIVWAARSWSGTRTVGDSGTVTGAAGPQLSGDRALDILRERYARGEITKDQYDAMRRDLTG